MLPPLTGISFPVVSHCGGGIGMLFSLITAIAASAGEGFVRTSAGVKVGNGGVPKLSNFSITVCISGVMLGAHWGFGPLGVKAFACIVSLVVIVLSDLLVSVELQEGIVISEDAPIKNATPVVNNFLFMID